MPSIGGTERQYDPFLPSRGTNLGTSSDPAIGGEVADSLNRVRRRGYWPDLFTRLDQIVRPKFKRLVRGFRPYLTPWESQRRVTRLAYLLKEFGKEDPAVYSFFLQLFLALLGLEWPKEVFNHDFTCTSAWKCRPHLGHECAVTYRREEVGYRKTAKKVLPDLYRQDPASAAGQVAAKLRGERRWMKDARDFFSFVELFIVNQTPREWLLSSSIALCLEDPRLTPIQALAAGSALIRVGRHGRRVGYAVRRIHRFSKSTNRRDGPWLQRDGRLVAEMHPMKIPCQRALLQGVRYRS